MNHPVIGLGTSDPMHGVVCPFRNTPVIRGVVYRIFRFYYGVKQSLAVYTALKSGYKLIDTSRSYNNLKWIKLAIFLTRTKRSDLCFVSRVSNQSQFRNSVRSDFFKDLKGFGINQFDLYQMHWPVTGHYIDTWKELLKLKEEGFIKHLGVANFNIHHLESLRSEGLPLPEVNQFEVHPLFAQEELVNYCRENGIIVQSYTPLGRQDSRIYESQKLKRLANRHNKTVSQIILRWHIQRETFPIPRSMNKTRIKENISIFDFKLSDEEMFDISSINTNTRLRFDPDNCDFTKL